MNLRGEVLTVPGMFEHKSDQFGLGDLYLSGVIEDRVMIPLMAARGHIHSHHAERELMLGLIKALSEDMMRLASSGIEDAQFPEAPLAHTVIPFKGGKRIFLGSHTVILS